MVLLVVLFRFDRCAALGFDVPLLEAAGLEGGPQATVALVDVMRRVRPAIGSLLLFAVLLEALLERLIGLSDVFDEICTDLAHFVDIVLAPRWILVLVPL